MKKAAIAKRHIDSSVSVIMAAHEVSEACALDVLYLRTCDRWTVELEKELIRLYKADTPPNVMEFGCTQETGNILLRNAEEILVGNILFNM